MGADSEIGHDDLRKFVTVLQSVAGGMKSTESNWTSKLSEMHAATLGGKAAGALELSARSNGSDVGTLRVLEPTDSVVSARIDSGLAPDTVDFYLTRPAGEGVVETRLLGTVKHPNSDGSWSLRFRTDRFTVSPEDAVLLHAEVRGLNGGLLALRGIGTIC